MSSRFGLTTQGQLPFIEPDDPDSEADLMPPWEDQPLRPLNWNLLTADEARAEWLDLDAWVDWLRESFGLPPTVVPPFWHRHDELVWELSALHQHWLNSYHPDASASAPHQWMRDFYDARERLREWTSTCGTKLDRDRPTRHTAWPGEPANVSSLEVVITDRAADFTQFVIEDVEARRRIEVHVAASA